MSIEIERLKKNERGREKGKEKRKYESSEVKKKGNIFRMGIDNNVNVKKQNRETDVWRKQKI